MKSREFEALADIIRGSNNEMAIKAVDQYGDAMSAYANAVLALGGVDLNAIRRGEMGQVTGNAGVQEAVAQASSSGLPTFGVGVGGNLDVLVGVSGIFDWLQDSGTKEWRSRFFGSINAGLALDASLGCALGGFTTKPDLVSGPAYSFQAAAHVAVGLQLFLFWQPPSVLDAIFWRNAHNWPFMGFQLTPGVGGGAKISGGMIGNFFNT